MLGVHAPEVLNNLFGLFHLKGDMVITVSQGQTAHLAPVPCLITFADENRNF